MQQCNVVADISSPAPGNLADSRWKHYSNSTYVMEHDSGASPNSTAACSALAGLASSRKTSCGLLLVAVLAFCCAEFALWLVQHGWSPLTAALIDTLLLMLVLGPTSYLLLRPLVRRDTDLHYVEPDTARLGRLLDNSSNEIYLFDADSLRYTGVSEGARRNLGYDMGELACLTPLDILGDFSGERLRALLEPLRQHEIEEVACEAQHRRKDGTAYPVELRVQLAHGESPPAFIALVQDISERKFYLSALEHRGLYDPLTELPNRGLLQDRLRQAVKTAHRSAAPLTVLVLDLVRLREVNDILGHANGDRVLQEVAKRLQQGLRDSDTVARLAGDEFAVVLPGTGVGHVSHVTGAILKALQQPIVIEGTPLEIEAAIGAAIYPGHGDDAAILLQRADIAMRIAKTEKMSFIVYDPHDDPYNMRHLRLFGELRQAISDRALVLYYQPQINLGTGRIEGVEALARWPHATEGLIQPADFIPMVEQSGLIRPFTLWMLEQAIAQCRRWSDDGIGLKVAVNLSTRNLLDPGLADKIVELLVRYRVRPAQLMLEITESAMMTRAETALKLIMRLQAIGLSLSIDDFGTGYSSLSYLKRLPVSELKIDHSFVSGMIANEHDAVIVRSTIELAHNLGLRVVAEGVENEAVLTALTALGCDSVQGYHLGRPLSADEFGHWLAVSPWSAFSPLHSALA